uniref:Reverse transcriptase domain-containing protein n=1 Tax=Nicotiana tabacum TaxID=4097 RepID=A0A1S4ARU7_TOBAC|nr:PREDICTED: uncharacterized protein LOC107800545 [Nicotiana tabacum]
MGEKRHRHSGGFNSAPYGGRGQFMRGQSSRPTYLAPPPSRGTPMRPYFSAISESSYRSPAIQGSSIGYSGLQGQTQGQSSSTPKETPTIDSVSMEREFSDVFPSDIPGMPLDHDIDFSIYLAPVKSFGLTNTPTTFMDFMNQVLQTYLDSIVIVFNDEILINSRSVEEHEQHLRVVLQTLPE